MKTARKTRPALWEKIKKEVLASDKGGKSGQWSARKAQIAVHLYKKQGGRYVGKKTAGNSLTKWTKQDWQYAGEPKKSRYLPKKAIEHLSPQEKGATNRAKRLGTKRGKQFVKQPKRIAQRVAKYRR